MLPGLVKALRGQTYPVRRVLGVDTGSQDRSGAVLAELLSTSAVSGMDRSTSYGAAVAAALKRNAERDERRVEWIWLLHDDCEPASDSLEQLLRAAGRDRSVAVLGPKVLDFGDRRVLRETGVAIDRAGRRVTGIEPGEIDQGQRDGNRPVLAVGSAGMLIRRDAWERLGGFDAELTMFRDDVDLCWRAQMAGFRVQVVTDALLYHRELAARRRRPLADGSPRRLDRQNALFVLAANLPLLAMLRIVAGCVAGSLLRALYFLVTKQQDAAWDQLSAVTGLLGHPLRLWRARRRRRKGRKNAYPVIRLHLPPGRTIAKLLEAAAGLLSSGPARTSGGLHHAADDPEDEQFTDTPSALRRVLANPGVRLFAVLTLIALIAERRLLSGGMLGGGALVPAWGGASDLWHEYLSGFHETGVGSAATAPPYLAVLAALATILGAKPWLAVEVLLLGCAPLAGLTSYLAARRITTLPWVRVLIAASYALLPVTMGAVAAGRLGSCVTIVLLPLIGMSAARMATAAPRAARRAAWAAGLLVALGAAFVPALWLFAAIAAAAAAIVCRWRGRELANAIIVVVAPAALLFPWTLRLLGGPSAFWLEAGVSRPGLADTAERPGGLLMLSPGGPGLPPVWVTAGLALAALAAVLVTGRTWLVRVGWSVAVGGMAAALLLSRVHAAQGDVVTNSWPGTALAVAAAGLLLAAVPAAEWVVPALKTGGTRKLGALGALAVTVSVPLLVAGYWVAGGVRGPVTSSASQVLPPFVAAAAAGPDQARTLVLRQGSPTLDYSVLGDRDPSLGEPELTEPPGASAALDDAVASLAADGDAEPGATLSRFGIGWVLVPSPVSQPLAQRLDQAGGLVPVSSAPAYDLWKVAGVAARIRVVMPNEDVVPVSANALRGGGAAAPAAGGTLLLAEPAGDWTATLNGKALTALPHPVDGWSQGFVLPPGGGTLAISRDETARDLSLILQAVALLAVIAFALPGKRAEATVSEPTAVGRGLRRVGSNVGGRLAGRRSRLPRGRLRGRRRGGEQPPPESVPERVLEPAGRAIGAASPEGSAGTGPIATSTFPARSDPFSTNTALTSTGPFSSGAASMDTASMDTASTGTGPFSADPFSSDTASTGTGPFSSDPFSSDPFGSDASATTTSTTATSATWISTDDVSAEVDSTTVISADEPAETRPTDTSFTDTSPADTSSTDTAERPVRSGTGAHRIAKHGRKPSRPWRKRGDS